MISLDIFETFFYWYIKLSLFQEEKNYTSYQRYNHLSSFKVPDLTAVFFGLLSSRIGEFLKNRNKHRNAPSSKGRSHHIYVDYGHGRVRL